MWLQQWKKYKQRVADMSLRCIIIIDIINPEFPHNAQGQDIFHIFV